MHRSSERRRFIRRRFLGGTFAAGTAAAVSRPARAAQFEFKCAGNNPMENPGTARVAQMWNAIEQESGGRIHTQFYPNGQLGTQTALFSQLRLGAIDFLHSNPGPVAELVPVAGICFLGFAYNSADEVARAMAGAVGDYVRREIAAKDMYLFRTIWTSGMYVLGSSTHPIQTVDDLRGFKVRTVDTKIQVDLFKTLGASPTPVSLNELYVALQTKLVDGEAQPMEVILTSKLYEVNKYVSQTNHSWAGECLFASASAWRRLPSDLQAIVERNNVKYVGFKTADVNAVDYAAELTRRGIAINQIDQAPFRARLRPYFETWSKEFGATAWDLLQTSLGRKLL